MTVTRAEELDAIEAAIAAGRVTHCPTATTEMLLDSLLAEGRRRRQHPGQAMRERNSIDRARWADTNRRRSNSKGHR